MTKKQSADHYGHSSPKPSSCLTRAAGQMIEIGSSAAPRLIGVRQGLLRHWLRLKLDFPQFCRRPDELMVPVVIPTS
jgi:hypothetical protein